MSKLKMKQSTLFSLKSWNKIAIEDIRKYKEILDNKDEAEVRILGTLASLKKKNPAKDSVLSSGLDLTLKNLVNHSNLRISCEVKLLIEHWKLGNNSKYNAIETSKENISKTSNSELDIEIVKVKSTFKTSESSSLAIIPESTLNAPKIQPSKIASTKFEDTKKEICKESSILQALKTEALKQVIKIQTPKQICKKVSINESKKNELKKRLQFAIQLFMEEVGQQEVKLYLETQP